MVELPKVAVPKVAVPTGIASKLRLPIAVFNAVVWIIAMAGLATLQDNSPETGYAAVVTWSLQWWTIFYQLIVIVLLLFLSLSPAAHARFKAAYQPHLIIVTVLLTILAQESCVSSYNYRNIGGAIKNGWGALAAGTVMMLLANYTWLLLEFTEAPSAAEEAYAAPAPPITTSPPASAVPVAAKAAPSDLKLASFGGAPPALTTPTDAPPVTASKSFGGGVASSASGINPYLVPPVPGVPTPRKPPANRPPSQSTSPPAPPKKADAPAPAALPAEEAPAEPALKTEASPEEYNMPLPPPAEAPKA